MTTQVSAVEQAREAVREWCGDLLGSSADRFDADVDDLIAAVRAERDAAWREGVEALTRYRGIKQSIQRNGDMVRWTWPADEKKHRYCANVLDRNDVLALAARMEAKCVTCGHPEDAHEVGGGACHTNEFASGASECVCQTYRSRA